MDIKDVFFGIFTFNTALVLIFVIVMVLIAAVDIFLIFSEDADIYSQLSCFSVLDFVIFPLTECRITRKIQDK